MRCLFSCACVPVWEWPRLTDVDLAYATVSTVFERRLMPEELENLKGVTITGWEIIDIDYGKPFIALKTNQKFEDNETVYLIISQDAELNGGGFVTFMDLKGAKELNY